MLNQPSNPPEGIEIGETEDDSERVERIRLAPNVARNLRSLAGRFGTKPAKVLEAAINCLDDKSAVRNSIDLAQLTRSVEGLEITLSLLAESNFAAAEALTDVVMQQHETLARAARSLAEKRSNIPVGPAKIAS